MYREPYTISNVMNFYTQELVYRMVEINRKLNFQVFPLSKMFYGEAENVIDFSFFFAPTLCVDILVLSFCIDLEMLFLLSI